MLRPETGPLRDTRSLILKTHQSLKPVSNPAYLKTFLEAQLPAALELLRQMVGINSFTLNPEAFSVVYR